MRRGAVGASLLLAACGGAGVRGGSLEPAGTQVDAVLARYRPVSCRDASGAAVRVPRVTALLAGPGPFVLFEERPGYPLLRFANAFDDGRELVFQLELSGDGGAVLREYRLAPGFASATLSVMDDWREQELPNGRFRAIPAARALSCRFERAARADLARQGAEPLARSALR